MQAHQEYETSLTLSDDGDNEGDDNGTYDVFTPTAAAFGEAMAIKKTVSTTLAPRMQSKQPSLVSTWSLTPRSRRRAISIPGTRSSSNSNTSSARGRAVGEPPRPVAVTPNAPVSPPPPPTSVAPTSVEPTGGARPVYLAAGVLPFCVLGGDLLFLLGQELRFRSRVRSAASSCSSHDGAEQCVKGARSRPPNDAWDVKGVVREEVSTGRVAGQQGCKQGRRDGSDDDEMSLMEGDGHARQKREAVHTAQRLERAEQEEQDARQHEHKQRQQAQVPAGLLWSDFGGGREAGDVDAEGTASREFAEESLGLFHGVRLESDSVARSQSAMETLLRDQSLRGKRVFECRNGGYVMFVAEVDFVPDIMMKLARKELTDSCVGSSDEGSDGGRGGGAPSPGFSEKTDFAWVPASSLLGAMRESRNRSTRKVVVRLGGCRYLRLFHKFVISLWNLDLPAVIEAVSTPLRRSKRPAPAPRVLLLKPGALSTGGGACSKNSSKQRGLCGGLDQNAVGAGGVEHEDEGGGDEDGDDDGELLFVGRCAVRGIDCIRPSFLSGRKRTSLGIIDEPIPRLHGSGRRWSPLRHYVGTGCTRGGERRTDAANIAEGCIGQAPAGKSDTVNDGVVEDRCSSFYDAGDENVSVWKREKWQGCAAASADESVSCATCSSGPEQHESPGGEARAAGGTSDRSKRRGRKSGAACRKKRRQCKEARRLKAAAAAAAAAAIGAVEIVATMAIDSAVHVVSTEGDRDQEKRFEEMSGSR